MFASSAATKRIKYLLVSTSVKMNKKSTLTGKANAFILTYLTKFLTDLIYTSTEVEWWIPW